MKAALPACALPVCRPNGTGGSPENSEIAQFRFLFFLIFVFRSIKKLKWKSDIKACLPTGSERSRYHSSVKAFPRCRGILIPENK